MVRKPASVLIAAGALVGLAVADAGAPHLPNPGNAGQLAFLAVVTIPLATLAVFAASPAQRLGWRLVPVAVLGIVVAVAAIHFGHPATVATVAKLVAASCIGMLLASMLQTGLEVVAIALVIAAVDIYSVAAGPTHEIVAHHPSVLDDVAINLRVPGSYAVAQIGSSDLIFFSLFCAATVRLGLRRWATWLAMTASFGVTIILADRLEVALPALPLLSLAFLAANADILWARRGAGPVPPNGSGQ
ncbi:MAG: hypothetical protein ACTHNU_14145 [Gaiellales bacterium]